MIIAAKRSMHSKRRTSDYAKSPWFALSRLVHALAIRAIIHIPENSRFLNLRFIAERSKRFGRSRLRGRGLAQISAIISCERFRLYSEDELSNAYHPFVSCHSPRLLTSLNSNLLFICDHGWESLTIVPLSRTSITFLFVRTRSLPLLIENYF